MLGEADHLASLLDNCVQNNVFEVSIIIIKSHIEDKDHMVNVLL